MVEADPQTTFNMHEAKTHFSRLVQRAHAGEEIIVARDGEPYARLMPLAAESLPPRTPGRFRGQLGDIPDSIWFDPFYSEEELDRFEGKGTDPA